MSLNLLTADVSGETLVVRWSASAFVLSNGTWTTPDGEHLLDEDYVVVSGSFTLPDGIKPRKYKIVNGALVPSAEFDGPEAPEPAVKAKEDYAVLTGGLFIAVVVTALGFARADQLWAASPSVYAAVLKADKIERTKDLVPAAIAYLQSLPVNPLTDPELAAVDAVWAEKE